MTETSLVQLAQKIIKYDLFFFTERTCLFEQYGKNECGRERPGAVTRRSGYGCLGGRDGGGPGEGRAPTGVGMVERRREYIVGDRDPSLTQCGLKQVLVEALL